MARHLVVTRTASGVERHPLKQWLRLNPDVLPPHIHPDTHTTRQLRSDGVVIGRLHTAPTVNAASGPSLSAYSAILNPSTSSP